MSAEKIAAMIPYVLTLRVLVSPFFVIASKYAYTPALSEIANHSKLPALNV